MSLTKIWFNRQAAVSSVIFACSPLAGRLFACRLHQPQRELPAVSIFVAVHKCFEVRREVETLPQRWRVSSA